MAELTTRHQDSRRRIAFRIAQLCRAIRDVLNARRVSVFLYDPSSETVSPFTSDQPEDERLKQLARSWSRIPLADFAAVRTVLLDQRPVAIEDAPRDDGLPPGLAAEFGVTSVHLEPLVATESVGILAIEPAGAAQNDDLRSIVPLVAASAGRIPVREEIEVGQNEAEFVLDLLEAAAFERSLERVLATVCERLARKTGARRAAAFLVENSHVAPRVARRADGAHDPEACERFETASSVPELIEAVVQSGEPLSAEEPGSPLVSGWWADTFELGSILAVPIKGPSGTIGALALESEGPRTFSESEVRLAVAVGTRIGGVVERAREVEEQTTHLQAATAVRQLLEEGSRALSAEQAGETLGRLTKQALEMEHAAVFLADNEDRIEYVGLDVPDRFETIVRERLVGARARDFRLWRRATRQPKPIFVEDARTSQLIPQELVTLLQIRSYVAFPLLSSERPLGLVVCIETRGPRRFSPEQRQLVAQLALEGSLVVENAALRALERQRLDELAQQAFHDSLTELPNRALFADRLEHALARLDRRAESVAVLLLDLDGFKSVNDSYGHEAGDQLLIAVGQRLRACLRPGDTVARLGGDEFTILLEEIAQLSEATRVAARIEDSLRTPFVLDGHEVMITTSIGIAFNRPGDSAPEELLRNADSAMYNAKRAGKARYEVHASDGNPSALEMDDVEGELSIRRSPITGTPDDPERESEDDGPLSREI
jgi:diguanylate cyclase (GGDEF)-like protein